MSNELSLIKRSAVLYQKMVDAINDCHSVEQCKVVEQQAAGIAAYYQQINDDESVRKFLLVKHRALRRIGEILLGRVDDSGCVTRMDHVRKIKAAFPDDPTVQIMHSATFYRIFEIMEVPDDFFHAEIEKQASLNGVIWAYRKIMRDEWEASPEGKAERKREEQEAAKRAKEYEKQKEETREEDEKRQEEIRAASRDRAELDKAKEEAVAEVGYTMDRRDRERMKQLVLLIKKPVHDKLRQAAFDYHITMQAILRAGLAMWFYGHGYPVDPGDLDLPLPSPPPRGPGRPRKPPEA